MSKILRNKSKNILSNQLNSKGNRYPILCNHRCVHEGLRTSANEAIDAVRPVINYSVEKTQEGAKQFLKFIDGKHPKASKRLAAVLLALGAAYEISEVDSRTSQAADKKELAASMRRSELNKFQADSETKVSALMTNANDTYFKYRSLSADLMQRGLNENIDTLTYQELIDTTAFKRYVNDSYFGPKYDAKQSVADLMSLMGLKNKYFLAMEEAKKEMVFQACIKVILKNDSYYEFRRWITRVFTREKKLYYEVVDIGLNPSDLRDYVYQSEILKQELEAMFPRTLTSEWIRADYAEAKNRICSLIESITVNGTEDNLYQAFRNDVETGLLQKEQAAIDYAIQNLREVHSAPVSPSDPARLEAPDNQLGTATQEGTTTSNNPSWWRKAFNWLTKKGPAQNQGQDNYPMPPNLGRSVTDEGRFQVQHPDMISLLLDVSAELAERVERINFENVRPPQPPDVT
jgi:hypothetical protein